MALIQVQPLAKASTATRFPGLEAVMPKWAAMAPPPNAGAQTRPQAVMPAAKATGIEAADMMSRRAIDVFQRGTPVAFPALNNAGMSTAVDRAIACNCSESSTVARRGAETVQGHGTIQCDQVLVPCCRYYSLWDWRTNAVLAVAYQFEHHPQTLKQCIPQRCQWQPQQLRRSLSLSQSWDCWFTMLSSLGRTSSTHQRRQAQASADGTGFPKKYR